MKRKFDLIARLTSTVSKVLGAVGWGGRGVRGGGSRDRGTGGRGLDVMDSEKRFPTINEHHWIVHLYQNLIDPIYWHKGLMDNISLACSMTNNQYK